MLNAHTMNYRVNNLLDRVPQLVEQVGADLTARGIPQAAVMTTCLCLEEILTNTIQYGYADAEDHEIRIGIERLGQTLTVDILDDATSFDPGTEAPVPDVDATLQERRIGGLGIHLVNNLAQSMDYRREGDHNHLTLAIAIVPER